MQFIVIHHHFRIGFYCSKHFSCWVSVFMWEFGETEFYHTIPLPIWRELGGVNNPKIEGLLVGLPHYRVFRW
jgi:hypothetical protein